MTHGGYWHTMGGAGGWLWPVIGVLIVVLLVVLIRRFALK